MNRRTSSAARGGKVAQNLSSADTPRETRGRREGAPQSAIRVFDYHARQEMLMKARLVLAAFVVCALMPTAALPQALTSLASVRVGYTTRKNTVKPQGEL